MKAEGHNPPSGAAKTAALSARRKNHREYVWALDFIPCEGTYALKLTREILFYFLFSPSLLKRISFGQMSSVDMMGRT